MNILFVCSGNMHRSPLAEAMLSAAIRRDGRTDLVVLSAGTLAIGGARAVPEACDLAAAEGLDLSAHRSRPLTREDVAKADLILVMERYHLESIASLQADATSRCRLLGDYAGPDVALKPGEDIPDAMGGDAASFGRSYRILRSCVDRLYRELPPAPEEVYTRAVEERLSRRRGRPLSLPPADFDLIDQWWASGVPLWIILESIDEVFSRGGHAGGPSQIRRLSFVAPHVEARHEAWRGSHDVRTSGENSPGSSVPPDAEREGDELLREAASHLLAAARNAGETGLTAARGILHEAARKVSNGGPAPDRASAVLRLHEIDEAIMAELRTTTEANLLAAMHADAETRLAPHRGRMTPAAFQATVSRLVDEGIRERYCLPRLAEGGVQQH